MAVRLTRAEQVERNHELVIDAARRVFLAKGYSGATLEAIAEEAGFSKGVVYSQFDSKADLFLTLLDRRVIERAAENERVVSGATGIDGIRAIVTAAERDVQAEPAWVRVLIEFRSVALRDPAVNRRYAESHGRAVARLGELLQQLLDRGNLTAVVPPKTIAEMIFAVGTGVTLERSANPDALPQDALMLMLNGAFGLTPTDADFGPILRTLGE
jgi:AcrR family transcriptional regulator